MSEPDPLKISKYLLLDVPSAYSLKKIVFDTPAAVLTKIVADSAAPSLSVTVKVKERLSTTDGAVKVIIA